MSLYGKQWDDYIKNVFPKKQAEQGLEWPGDEWFQQSYWIALFEKLFGPDVATWKSAVEIGAGSGKYTEMVFNAAPDCRILAFDVSAEFLDVCTERLADYVKGGRLAGELLRGEQPDEMLQAIEKHGLRGTLDGFFSIDAMVHVDLQYLVVYLLTAGLSLRKGGKLVLTLADACSEAGYKHLMEGIARQYRLQGNPGIKFEFLGPDIVAKTLERLGFVPECLENWHVGGEQTGRDLFVVARLEHPERAAEQLHYLRGS